MAAATVHYEGPIVTRDEARAAGLKKFYTGRACAHGHLAQRFVSSKGCTVCVDTRKKAFRAANPEYQKEQAARYWTGYSEKHGERLRLKRRDGLPEMICVQCGATIPFPDEVQPGYTKMSRAHYCSLACRYWSKVDKRGDDECWGWNGSKHYFGYGMFGEEKAGKAKAYTAHTVSWMLANGREIPDGMFVLHSCDNPECSNPAHLRLGTPQDNIDDMVRKGRHQHGENHPLAKLTDDQVRQIRADKRKLDDIAREVGLRPNTISRIKTRAIFSHVP